MYPQGCGGSSPFFGTKVSQRQLKLRQLIEEARTIGGHKTKKEAVTAALSDYVLRCEQTGIIKLFGTIDYDPAYDYKPERQRKRISRSQYR
jgi:hypothetical protein